jgi:antitoxin MazE3
MSKQIAVQLPSELIEFLDEAVANGNAHNRTAVITRALERERRRAISERDAKILAHSGLDPELVALAEHCRRLPPALD